MTDKEKQNFLENHLEALKSAVEDAADDGFYADIPEISKQILEVLDRIPTM